MASANVGGTGPSGSSGGIPPAGPPRPDRGGGTPPGQERTISFQPEERYWTDYLRILLPVAGLLILVGLLWWWATEIIGGPTGTEPPLTPTGGNNIAAVTDGTDTVQAPLASPTAPATPPAPAVNPGAPPTATPPPTPPAAPVEEATAPAVAAGTEPATEGEPAAAQGDTEREFDTYAVGDTVVTTADVNLRQEASAQSESLGILAPGTEVVVTGNFENFDPPELDWWPVRTSDGRQGFIREDFLGPQEE